MFVLVASIWLLVNTFSFKQKDVEQINTTELVIDKGGVL